MCDAFRACRAREATCGSWTWAVHILRCIPQLHPLQTTKIWSGQGLETRLVYERAEPSVLAVLEQLVQLYMWSQTVSVVNVSVPYSQTDTLTSMWSATPTHLVCKAWCRYVFLVLSGNFMLTESHSTIEVDMAREILDCYTLSSVPIWEDVL